MEGQRVSRGTIKPH